MGPSPTTNSSYRVVVRRAILGAYFGNIPLSQARHWATILLTTLKEAPVTSRQFIFLAGCLVAAGCNVSQIIATPGVRPSGSDVPATPTPSVSAQAGASGTPTDTPVAGPTLSPPPILGTPSPFPTGLPVPTRTPTPAPTTYFGPGYPGPPG